VQEAYYETGGRKYFALAFANDCGGYELRNKYYKGSSSPKGITTIASPDTARVNVFEGFFDFLSALEHFGVDKPACTTLILNSLNFLPDLMPTLAEYEQVNVFFDRDRAGIEATAQVLQLGKAQDKSGTYAGYKDFNQFLIS
jgi:hypothetical protein